MELSSKTLFNDEQSVIYRMNMPAKGFKSITVREEVYNYFWEEWQTAKKKYPLEKGITSFSAFVTKRLYDLIQQEKKRNPR